MHTYLQDHKNLMEELSQLERCDRQRRQDAVAKIPVSILESHKCLIIIINDY